MKEARLAAARDRAHGLQVMTLEGLAVRLAGGFVRPIDDETLRDAIQTVLPDTDLGELEDIKTLPGMILAAAGTLKRVWRANIDLSAQTHPRLAALADLEAAVLAELPADMARPADIAAAAIARAGHAPVVIGPVTIAGHYTVSPCWRPLLTALAAQIPVQWEAGPRPTQEFPDIPEIKVSKSPPKKPEICVMSAATEYHEAVEAMRWARSLLAAGVPAGEIAIAAASPAGYDNHFLALRADANINLHFAHGVSILASRDGQAAAALADIVVRGLSQPRFRRLLRLCHDAPVLKDLPEGWRRVLPADAPLSSPDAWDRLLERLTPDDWPDGSDHAPALRAAVALLQQGAGSAAETGEAFLTGLSLAFWRKALLAGPAIAIDGTLETLRQADGLQDAVSVIWAPAAALAGSPRRFVRLLGLNSTRWPRGLSEDRLIPEHIIPADQLDPMPVNLADALDFETILATTRRQVVLSRARRDGEGRLLGRSPLLINHGEETFLPRNAPPPHAFSETDRLVARHDDFADDRQAKSATLCWRNWRRSAVTAHDGLLRADHPLAIAILNRTQSANSLRKLLRNPLGFLWTYGFRWRAPESSAEPLVLEPLAFGTLTHDILDRALKDLERSGGLRAANEDDIGAAVDQATKTVAADWEHQYAIPPAVIWNRTLDIIREMARVGLAPRDDVSPGARTFGEVAFGGAAADQGPNTPWHPGAPVAIADAHGPIFRINGRIDRLDLSGDGAHAIVRDYKTGKPPKNNSIQLGGGSELQRCLYAYAVKALLGEKTAVSASLFYLRDGVERQLEDPDGTLLETARHLRAARRSFASGGALPGPDAGDSFDDLAFALPANANALYRKRVAAGVADRLGEAARVWEAE